ncbi:MAG: hypothetical protein A4E39_01615 [Methanoregulaceae archaeon PtaB.Bin152]|nr:MAG: hypothetical protein A4E39_01615 [Methanoregulaceae archaeon PtaB.Bin152]
MNPSPLTFTSPPFLSTSRARTASWPVASTAILHPTVSGSTWRPAISTGVQFTTRPERRRSPLIITSSTEKRLKNSTPASHAEAVSFETASTEPAT